LENTAIVIADTAGAICFWSKGAQRAFGYPVESALGRTLDLIVPEEFRASHWAGFRRAVASGSAALEGQPGGFPVLHADGRVENVPGTLTLLRNGGGAVVGCMVVFG